MVNKGVLMVSINNYFVSRGENGIRRLLLEALDNSNDSLSCTYYDLILKRTNDRHDSSSYDIISIHEIYNIIDFLLKHFGSNIKRRKLDDETNDYLIKMMNFQTYKKGFNERLVKRLSAYLEAMEDSPRINL